MIEAVTFWNEPNNRSHWDFEVDPDWRKFSEMIRLASRAVREVNPQLTQVLGGTSPIDPHFAARMRDQGVLEGLDAYGVHGFPLDWNHWQINDWPERIQAVAAAIHLPIWVTEVGVSTFGADEVQVFGLERTAHLLRGVVPKAFWYSLFDLPNAWPATTRHRESEGSSYYRHFYMGLVREDGTEKPAYAAFRQFAPRLGICQWFHFEDHRLDDAVMRLHDLGATDLRTGLSWADFFRPNALEWFDRQMEALNDFRLTITFCFTPEHLGEVANHTSAPRDLHTFAEFCAGMVSRYAPEKQPSGNFGPTAAVAGAIANEFTGISL